MRQQIVTTEEALEALVEDYLRFESFAFDTETRGTRPKLYEKDEPSLDWRTNDVFWVSLAGPGRSDVIPIGHPTGRLIMPSYVAKAPAAECPDKRRCHQCGTLGRQPKLTKKGIPSKARVNHDIKAHFGPPPPQLTHEQVWPVLKRLFFSSATKIGHNVKFDVKSTAKYLGGPMPGPFIDTEPLARCVDENFTSYKLGDVTSRELRWSYDKSLGKKGVENFSFGDAAQYARSDAFATWHNCRILLDKLDREGKVWDVFFDVEMPLLEVVIDMEMEGAPLDVEEAVALEADLAERLEVLYETIEEANGGPINLNADAQVRRLVYEKLGYRPLLFTKEAGLPSTSKKALEGYAYKNPRADDPTEPKNIRNKVVAAILEWAETYKLWSTFAVPLVARGQETGRIFAEFDQLGARTGRFSSRNPNLQNIPVRSGPRVRRLFKPPSGWKLVIADYSQIELRVLAHFTKDPLLTKAYVDKLDLHEMTARSAYRIPADQEVPYLKRAAAKNCNFCVPMDTQALTIEGWKSYDEIKVGDVVLGEDEGVLRWTEVTEKHFFTDCEFTRLRSGQFNAVTTAGHRWVGTKLVDRGKGGRVEVPSIFTTEEMSKTHTIRTSALARTENLLDVSAVEAAVIAWLHTDGSIVRSTFTGAPAQAGGMKVGFRGIIFQSKLEGLVHLRWLLAKVPHRERLRADGKLVEFHLDPCWLRDLWERAELDDQTLEQFTLRLGVGERQAFVDAAWRAEGWMNGNTKTMAQNRGPVCDAMRTAAFMLGHHVTTTSNGVYKGRENVNLSLCRPRVTGQRMRKEAAGRGDAWCISTGLGSWVMRQGDQVTLTGNSVAYGGTAWTLMTRYNVAEADAEAVVDGFYKTYKCVRPWQNQTVKECKGRGKSKKYHGRHQDPYVETILGRRRRLPEILWPQCDPENRKKRIEANERQAINSRIQGSAGDIAKLAMIDLHRRFKETGCGRIIMMVHDELVCLVPEDRAEEARVLVQKCMEAVGPRLNLRVPVVADAHVADTWAEK